MFVASSPILQGFAIGAVTACRGMEITSRLREQCANLMNGDSTLAASDFNWEMLTADTKLNWTPCYSGFQCSRLQVPLDYSAPQSEFASIAIVRLPSTSPKSEYRGPILFNPGGPGGSGVDAIVGAGAAFATVFGPEFDIVGFDPRGVSYSTPTISFFKTDAECRFLIPSAEVVIYPSLNASSNAVSKTWCDFGLLGQLALQSDTEHHLQHMSTDNIAREMLQLTQAFGFEKLQYWGISYGSVLGAMFATLFPDKVGRLMIDGFEDMDLLHLRTRGSTSMAVCRHSLTDATKLASFECQASPPPFHLKNFESYAAIACGDPVPVNDTLAELEEYWLNTAKVSQFSDLVSISRVLCAGYKIHRQGRFQGPVGAQNTSFPLLLVGNTLDPATARAGALKTSEAFPGSVVLTQDSVGHTSLVAPSSCTYRHFRTYFLNGTLPAPGTVSRRCGSYSRPLPTSPQRDDYQVLRSRDYWTPGREISSIMRRVVSCGAL
ncbi:AB hydrolase-1 domain-containing protein [Mycena venus]|uniref:AB hydrolase-1 domain-containing protein n=1 Tax=Mycena venus TaxID=2733690 RepID=A0A8H6Y1T2_9AGAR|nr:AB hydrolase-1 domain-containing protein [Mycena venus]